MFLYKYKNKYFPPLKTTVFQGFLAALHTDEDMGWYDLVLFLRAKKANVPTLGPRFLVKFPRAVEKAIEVKCPTYARRVPPPPLGPNIDRCITFRGQIKARATPSFPISIIREFPLRAFSCTQLTCVLVWIKFTHLLRSFLITSYSLAKSASLLRQAVKSNQWVTKKLSLLVFTDGQNVFK